MFATPFLRSRAASHPSTVHTAQASSSSLGSSIGQANTIFSGCDTFTPNPCSDEGISGLVFLVKGIS